MMVKGLYLLAASLALSGSLYARDDPAGTWRIEATPQMPSVTLVLDVNGSVVTGTLKQGEQPEEQVSEGTVDGDVITFKRIVDSPQGAVTISYVGELDGDTMTLTRSFEGGPFADDADDAAEWQVPPLVLTRQ
jgi:hypothetical protein